MTQGRGELSKTGSRPRTKLNKHKASVMATQMQITMDMAGPLSVRVTRPARGEAARSPSGGQMAGRRKPGRWVSATSTARARARQLR